jgi:hypothetical protein
LFGHKQHKNTNGIFNLTFRFQSSQDSSEDSDHTRPKTPDDLTDDEEDEETGAQEEFGDEESEEREGAERVHRTRVNFYDQEEGSDSERDNSPQQGADG